MFNNDKEVATDLFQTNKFFPLLFFFLSIVLSFGASGFKQSSSLFSGVVGCCVLVFCFALIFVYQWLEKYERTMLGLVFGLEKF